MADLVGNHVFTTQTDQAIIILIMPISPNSCPFRALSPRNCPFRPEIAHFAPFRPKLPISYFSTTGNEPCCKETGLRGFRPGPTQTVLCSLEQYKYIYTLSSVQSRNLKFLIWVVEELYYPYSENKDADQLHVRLPRS